MKAMKDLIARIPAKFRKERRATVKQLARLESKVKRVLPDDYKTLLLWSNGGEGKIGSSYVSFWSTVDLPAYNSDYVIDEYLPDILGIGGDGGGKCYALDYRKPGAVPPLIRVPLGDLEYDAIVVLGNSLREWFSKLLEV